jgi:hypothetical protein
MLDTTISYTPLTGRDGNNTKTYGAAVTLAARIERGVRLERGPEGAKDFPGAVITTHAAVPRDALVKLPEDSAGRPVTNQRRGNMPGLGFTVWQTEVQ